MNVPGDICICVYKYLIAESVTFTSTIFELIFTLFIVTCGVIVNLRYRNKLKEEKREMPLGRRGNVIEPVMSWFCILQMIFWPYELLFLWINTNEVVPFESLPSWLCYVLVLGMRTGRMCVAYNSFFVALIRYAYIVKPQRSNQWDYEKMSKRFKMASVIFPIIMEIMNNLTIRVDNVLFARIPKVRDCLSGVPRLNSTTNIQLLSSSEQVDWTMQDLPASLALLIPYIFQIFGGLVALNVPEAFLYLSIFRSMKR